MPSVAAPAAAAAPLASLYIAPDGVRRTILLPHLRAQFSETPTGQIAFETLPATAPYVKPYKVATVPPDSAEAVEEFKQALEAFHEARETFRRAQEAFLDSPAGTWMKSHLYPQTPADDAQQAVQRHSAPLMEVLPKYGAILQADISYNAAPTAIQDIRIAVQIRPKFRAEVVRLPEEVAPYALVSREVRDGVIHAVYATADTMPHPHKERDKALVGATTATLKELQDFRRYWGGFFGLGQ